MIERYNSTHENLVMLRNFINQMKATSSLNKKKLILEAYENDEFIKKVLFYALNPNYQFNITSKSIRKNPDIAGQQFDDLFELFDVLRTKALRGHDAIGAVNAFITTNPEFESEILQIVDKKLEIRCNASVINKVIPNLIPIYDVALAQTYKGNGYDEKQLGNEIWLASRKLDGVRCQVLVDEKGKAQARSRKGKLFTTLDNVLTDIEELAKLHRLTNVVFDGEICMIDKNGNEDFQGIMKQIRKKDHTIENPKYIIFDYLSLDEFEKRTTSSDLMSRLGTLSNYIDNPEHSIELDTLNTLKMDVVNEGVFNSYVDMVKDRNWEGFMLRANVPYEGKRTKNLLKVKVFFDKEYIVESIGSDVHRVIRDGREVEIEMLAQVYITHKGNQVAVGSGFSQEERIKYHTNPELIIGRQITVQYFAETQNQKGEYSLRFPTVKFVFGQNGRQD